MKFAVTLAAAVSTLALSAPADAATYLFSLSGDYTGSFQLDSSPTPASFNFFSFTLTGITGDLPGLKSSGGVIDFYDPDGAGDPTFNGFTLSDPAKGVLVDPFGAKLFSGPTSAPTFLLGTYSLVNNANNLAPVRLVISEAAAAVPEPATWAMMLVGFGLVGGFMRRRQNQSASVRFAF